MVLKRLLIDGLKSLGESQFRMRSFAICFGTRPELLKLRPVISEFQNSNINKFIVIYIKQHSELQENIDPSWIQLNIKSSDSASRLNLLGSQILENLPKYITEYTDIIVQGDTATAYYSALCGFQLQKRIIHIEAGLRTYDLERPFPEEAYRQMISRIATIHFTPHEDCSLLLKKENVCGKIITVGNTILDLIKSYDLNTTPTNTVVITFHRRENWALIDNFILGLKKLMNVFYNFEFIWYLHPNKELQNKVRSSIYDIPNIRLAEPLNHKLFTEILAKSAFVITDSGGIQEEATFLGKHCFVLRKSTERNHLSSSYITIVDDFDNLCTIIQNKTISVLEPCFTYGHGNSSKSILSNI